MSICDNPMGKMMFETAIMDLSSGFVTPFDKQVLSYTPLPENFIDPYVSQVVRSKTAMELTYTSLSVWIEEAKKASYFSKHFVTLSKLINNGVVSMARGLATLHACGKSLEKVPMSIQDLIMVSSYHIRKSYLGVLQTSASQPEIGERLLTNQLTWTNTLLRLYKTKEKLDQPAAPLLEAAAGDGGMLPTGENKKNLKASKQEGLQALPAISTPSRYTSVRAYGPNCKKSKASSQNGTLDSFFAAAKPAQKNCTVLRHSSFEQKTNEDVLKRTTETAESSEPEAKTDPDDIVDFMNTDWDDLDDEVKAYIQTLPPMPDLFYEPIPIPIGKNKKLGTEQNTS